MTTQTDDQPVSLAVLLDEVRPLITNAREQGENPRYLLLPARPFDAVRRAKADEVKRNVAVTVLGMEIVRSDNDDVPPRVF